MDKGIRTELPGDQTQIEASVRKLLTPLENFIHRQTTAAILLLLATFAALIIAQSPWADIVTGLAQTKTGFIAGQWRFLLPVQEWIGSGMMALFFFLIGLEIKRETLAGKLRDPQHVTLIAMAAVGGMVFPAAIYWLLNHGTPAAQGWAIPMATDTAFALGVLALLTRHVSTGVSGFLAAMAIFDDIGAIIIISLFYGHAPQIDLFLAAAGIMTLLFLLNIAGVRNGWVYAFLGVVLWFVIYHSGLHATLTGLLMAIVVPARTQMGEKGFVREVRSLLSIFERGQRGQDGMLGAPAQHFIAVDIAETVRAVSTPLQRWETSLVNPIGIVVLPLFAFFNAGILLSWQGVSAALGSPVTQGIMAGLVLGKPAGVLLMTAIGLKLKLGKLPDGMSFSEVAGVGMLAGIGFTMSLFITILGFDRPGMEIFIDDAKTGIVLSSLISAVLAAMWIYQTKKGRMIT
jgi:NhaA family Na+:H+ antiporter